MQFESKEIGEDLIEVTLTGRLDIQGAAEIDMPFTSVAATKRAGVLVDMSGVDFIASIGIRTLLSSAKALAGRGGKMVLHKPTDLVRSVLVTSGIDNMVPIIDDRDAAVAALADSMS
jgi:anti-sigma B factor antagonist